MTEQSLAGKTPWMMQQRETNGIFLTPFISHICNFCDFKCFLNFWYDSSHDCHKGRTGQNQERIVDHTMQRSATVDKDNYDIT